MGQKLNNEKGSGELGWEGDGMSGRSINTVMMVGFIER